MLKDTWSKRGMTRIFTEVHTVTGKWSPKALGARHCFHRPHKSILVYCVMTLFTAST